MRRVTQRFPRMAYRRVIDRLIDAITDMELSEHDQLRYDRMTVRQRYEYDRKRNYFRRVLLSAVELRDDLSDRP